MVNIVCCDQSFSATALTFWTDGELRAFGLTGCPKVSKEENYEFYSGLWVKGEEGFEQAFRSSKETPIKGCNIFDRAYVIAEEYDMMLEYISGTEHIDDYFDKYIFEQLAFGGVGNASRDLAILLGTIINQDTYINDEKLLLVSPTSAKKVFTGSGKAKKPEMVAALPEEVREIFESFDIGMTKTKKRWKGLDDLADSYSFYKWYEEKGK